MSDVTTTTPSMPALPGQDVATARPGSAQRRNAIARSIAIAVEVMPGVHAIGNKFARAAAATGSAVGTRDIPFGVRVRDDAARLDVDIDVVAVYPRDLKDLGGRIRATILKTLGAVPDATPGEVTVTIIDVADLAQIEAELKAEAKRAASVQAAKDKTAAAVATVGQTIDDVSEKTRTATADASAKTRAAVEDASDRSRVVVADLSENTRAAAAEASAAVSRATAAVAATLDEAGAAVSKKADEIDEAIAESRVEEPLLPEEPLADEVSVTETPTVVVVVDPDSEAVSASTGAVTIDVVDDGIDDAPEGGQRPAQR